MHDFWHISAVVSPVLWNIAIRIRLNNKWTKHWSYIDCLCWQSKVTSISTLITTGDTIPINEQVGTVRSHWSESLSRSMNEPFLHVLRNSWQFKQKKKIETETNSITTSYGSVDCKKRLNQPILQLFTAESLNSIQTQFREEPVVGSVPVTYLTDMNAFTSCPIFTFLVQKQNLSPTEHAITD